MAFEPFVSIAACSDEEWLKQELDLVQISIQHPRRVPSEEYHVWAEMTAAPAYL